jgi:carbonic anhydrase
VATALARGKLRLHGWFFEIESGQVLAYCGERSRFIPIDEATGVPVAQASAMGMKPSPRSGGCADG